MTSLLVFLQLQLDRIKAKSPTHAPGPKKPDLTLLDYTMIPRKDK